MKNNVSKFLKRFVGIFIIVPGLFITSSAMASGFCSEFTLVSNVILLGPAGPAVGTAEITMDNGAVFQITAEGEITSSKVDEEGNIHMRVRELDDWGPFGTTIGKDRLKLVPTEIPGEFTLTIKTFIEGNTGAVEDVFGFYKGSGNISFSTGSLTHQGRGRICNLPF